MPVRNGERWLASCLASMFAQTAGDFEFLVVDNGSTDRTDEILARAAARDQRLVVISEPRPGVVPALNAGLWAARGALIARIDVDDIARPHRLGRQLDFMSRHPDVGLLGSWADVIDNEGVIRGHRRPATAHADLVRLLDSRNPFIHSSIVFRTDLVRGIGGYRSAFEVSEDYDLWLRLSEITKLANIPEPLVLYRHVPSAATNRKSLHQAFSVHLARCSARIRRTTGSDPVSDLQAAPDWWDKDCDRSFFAVEARLFRLLGLADHEAVGRVDLAAIEAIDPSDLMFGLNGTDRKLARRAIANLLARIPLRQPGVTFRLLASLAKLATARAERRQEDYASA
jgi:glycosyltransferase involved in cell wall biosynthesis